MRLLVAEDEQAMAEAVKAYLSYYHYTVDWVSNGKDALEACMNQTYDGAILDIMMPQMDGLEVLSTLRRMGYTLPVLLLTAKGELGDKVEGFERGADDYLAKPFAMEELLARVKAMLRRRSQYLPDILTLEDVSLDMNRGLLLCNGQECALSPKEMQLMELFLSHPGMFFSSETLLDRIWGTETAVAHGTVWAHISWLRKKLSLLGAHIEICSRRGIGYCVERIK